MTQNELRLNIPRNTELRLLPIEKLAHCKSERQALRVCLDNAPRSLSDGQWAALLKVTKSQFSEYFREDGDRKKHIPERIRDEAQRLAGNLAINQYWDLKYRHTPVPLSQQERESYLEQRLRALGDE
jgi:hypothetical protein